MLRYLYLLLLLVVTLPIIAQPANHYISIEKGGLASWLSYNKAEPKYLISAHRGGRHIDGYPENAIETFQYIVEHGPAMIECDVRMTADSVLVLLHDKSLDRTTTGGGLLSDKLLEEIQHLHLYDDFGTLTKYSIPTLREVLEWTKGKAIITLDVKRGTPFDRVIELIRETHAEDYAVIITYNIVDAKRVYALAPELVQSVTIRNQEELDWFTASGIPASQVIAFTGTRLSPPEHYRALHKLGILTIIGTMGNLDRRAMSSGEQYYRDLLRRGGDILATDRPLEAGAAIRKMN